MKYLRTKRAVQHLVIDAAKFHNSKIKKVLVLPGISGFDVLDILSKMQDSYVVGLERDIKVYNINKHRFKDNKNVEIVLGDMYDYLKDTDHVFDYILLDTFSKWGTYLRILVEYCLFSGVLSPKGSLSINFVGNRETKSEQEIQRNAAKNLLGRTPDNAKERRIASVNSFLHSVSCPCKPPNWYVYKSGATYMYFFTLNLRSKTNTSKKYEWANYKPFYREMGDIQKAQEKELGLVLEEDGYQEVLNRSLYMLREDKSHSKIIKEGIEKARKNGKVIGRPSLPPETIEKILKLKREKGLSIRKIAAHRGVNASKTSVERIINTYL